MVRTFYSISIAEKNENIGKIGSRTGKQLVNGHMVSSENKTAYSNFSATHVNKLFAP